MDLTPEALEALREALLAVRTGASTPRVTLATVASALSRVREHLPEGMGLTVDFRAAETLGQPLVIVRPSRGQPDLFEALTPREREVAGLVAVGLRNRDVAIALGIAVATVKDHVHRILTKSGLDSRAAIAAEYRR
ncbi:MAG: helix-turn-helix transcriptional regulator [Myxococcota bacterium]